MLQRGIKPFSGPSLALIFDLRSKTSRFRSLQPVSKGRSMFIAKLIGWYRMWSRYERGVRELAQLSDRELADIGVTRSEIPAIAWHDAHR
jgi:uncharacterized protein YjiS (DUF1127 family)